MAAVIAFDITAPSPGKYFLSIADGFCQAFSGIPNQADLTIHAPSDVWVSICKGELNGQKAMMEGQYYIDGNLQLLIKLKKIFGTGHTASTQPAQQQEARKTLPTALECAWGNG